MVGDTQIWQDEYPHTLRYRDTTLHRQGPIAPHTRQAFEELIAQSANAKRVSAPLACVQSQLFTKREKLDSLKRSCACNAEGPSATACTTGLSRN